MSEGWRDRPIVDARGGTMQVDWPRLALVLVLATASANLVFWVVPSPWDYAIVGAVGLLIVVFDVRRARRRNRGRSYAPILRDKRQWHVRWFPSGSMAEREAWSRANPWFAGLWFGLFMGLVAGAFIGWAISIGAGVLTGLAVMPLSGVLFAVMLRSAPRWLDRPNAESFAAPSRRAPWSRVSDRMLAYISYFGLGIIAFSLVELLLTGPDFGDVILVFYVWLTYTSIAERRRRSHA